jgi:hypothetical protein
LVATREGGTFSSNTRGEFQRRVVFSNKNREVEAEVEMDRRKATEQNT